VDKTSKNIDGGFLHFQRFINVLLRIETKSGEINDLIEYYRQNICEINEHQSVIHEFEKTYDKNNALDW